MRKTGICLIIYLLILSILITPVALGRYNNTVYGVAWDIYFSEKTIDTDTFHISDDSFVKVDPETGEEIPLDELLSENLWGADGNVDWENKTERDQYKVGNLEKTEFSLKNTSSNDLLVTFEVAVCATPKAIFNIVNAPIDLEFTITNNNTKESVSGDFKSNANTDNPKEVPLTKGDLLYTDRSSFGVSYEYYEYTGTANPATLESVQNPSPENLPGFVIPANSNIVYTYELKIEFNQWSEDITNDSVYASIKMKVEKIP